MSTIVRIPKLYENMDEGTITEWHVRAGDRVKRGDVLAELVTDKTAAELEAPEDGVVLAVYAPEKSTLPVGYAVAAVGSDGESAPDVEKENAEILARHSAAAGVLEAFAAGGAPESGGSRGGGEKTARGRSAVRAAPAARALARKHGVRLEDVAAACGKNVIQRKDVEAYLAAREKSAGSAEGAQSESAEPGASGAVVWAADALAGKTALVTGAAGGIGRSICVRLAAAGADVAVHYRRNREGAEAVAEQVRALGRKAVIVQADVSDGEDVRRMVDTVMEEFGGLDILVNNAGILADALLTFMQDAQWQRVIDVNLTGPFYTMRAAAMLMARKRSGCIVNIASDAGRMGAANRSNYAAAKEGLVALTRSAARELAGLGVRVNAVSPGFVETPMTESLPDARRRELLRNIPMRRLGVPEEIADVVVFLCTQAAAYMTGQVIFVDGGMFMG